MIQVSSQDRHRYLDLAIQLIQLYQRHLLEFLAKYDYNSIITFKSDFEHFYQQLRKAEIAKSIQETKVTQICLPMSQFLNKNAYIKIKKASNVHSARYQTRDNQQITAHRSTSRQNPRFRFTGMKKTSKRIQHEQIQQISQQSQCMKKENKVKAIPKMTMKWISFKQNQDVIMDDEVEKTKKKVRVGSFGANNIEMLSQTIPEMQDSIKRLSLSQGRSCGVDIYRTIDWKAQSRKKYIARLF